jgi:hypothetical protein
MPASVKVSFSTYYGYLEGTGLGLVIEKSIVPVLADQLPNGNYKLIGYEYHPYSIGDGYSYYPLLLINKKVILKTQWIRWMGSPPNYPICYQEGQNHTNWYKDISLYETTLELKLKELNITLDSISKKNMYFEGSFEFMSLHQISQTFLYELSRQVTPQFRNITGIEDIEKVIAFDDFKYDFEPGKPYINANRIIRVLNTDGYSYMRICIRSASYPLVFSGVLVKWRSLKDNEYINITDSVGIGDAEFELVLDHLISYDYKTETYYYDENDEFLQKLKEANGGKIDFSWASAEDIIKGIKEFYIPIQRKEDTGLNFDCQIRCGYPDVIVRLYFSSEIEADVITEIQTLYIEFLNMWNQNNQEPIHFIGNVIKNSKKALKTHFDFGNCDESIIDDLIKFISDRRKDIVKVVLE